MFNELLLKKARLGQNTEDTLNTMEVLDSKLAELYGWDCSSPISNKTLRTKHSPRESSRCFEFSIDELSNNSDFDEPEENSKYKASFFKLQSNIFNIDEDAVSVDQVESVEKQLDIDDHPEVVSGTVKLHIPENSFSNFIQVTPAFFKSSSIAPTYANETPTFTGTKEFSIRKEQKSKAPKSKKCRRGRKRDRKLARIQRELNEQQVGEPKITPASTNIAETVYIGQPSQYCICKTQQFEDMIECDNPRCKGEWFHFS